MAEIKGWHVLVVFVLAFGVIIAVNVTLAYNAIRTFPGLEVKNSYIASQSFEQNRRAQLSLGWDVSALVRDGLLELTVTEKGQPIAPVIESAILGRATHVAQDQTLDFVFDGTAFVSPIDVLPGNWNLRLRLRADGGELFSQRLQVKVLP